jgi:hypothetical protein
MLTLFLVPFINTILGCILGNQLRLVCLLEWLTLLPKLAALPQISHFISSPFDRSLW